MSIKYPVDKPKILFVLHMPPPVHGAAVIGEYIYDSKIINNSFNCRYINFSLSQKIEEVGKFRIIKIFYYLRLIKSLCTQIYSFKPDLCYVTPSARKISISELLKDLIVVMLIKLFGKKVVLHFHNKGISSSQDKWLFDKCYKMHFKNTKVILLSDLLYNDIKKYVNKSNVYICPNGIPVRTISTIKSDRFYILFLSNMMADKGVWTLFDACRKLKDNGLDFECHFVGKWKDISESEFKNKILQHNMGEYIFYHGATYGEKKDDYLARSDIFAFPTRNETFGLVLLEAMQYSLPCISSCEGGIPDIIENGVTGFTIENISSAELSDKIIFLKNNPEIRKRMGNAGKERYNKFFSIDVFEKKIEDTFKSILSVQK